MDFLLDYGDISISSIDINYSYYDLDLEELDKSIPNLIKRAIQTPKGYLKLLSTINTDYLYLDKDYGSNLYQQLGEPFLFNTLEIIKNDIENSLSLLNIPALIINSVNILSYSLSSISIQINYTYNNVIDNYQLDIIL